MFSNEQLHRKAVMGDMSGVQVENTDLLRGIKAQVALYQALTQGSLIRPYQDYFNSLGLF